MKATQSSKSVRKRLINYFIVTWLIGFAAVLAISLLMSSLTFPAGFIVTTGPIPIFIITFLVGLGMMRRMHKSERKIAKSASVSQLGSGAYKFCRKCGTEVPVDTNFCPSCGSKLE